MTIEQVKQWLNDEKQKGFINSYYFRKCEIRGLVFFVETDQGFNPEPVWQQFED